MNFNSIDEINDYYDIERRERSHHNAGYIDGLSDARNDRTPEHSHTAYSFPHYATADEQACYNAGYYDGKRAYSEERARLAGAQ